MSRKFQGTNYAHYKKCEACERKKFCNEENKPMIAYNILRDSEGFYYVFCKLEEIDTVPKFTPDSEKRRRDLEEYEKRHRQLPFLMSPMITNGALAIELAFKFLIFKENLEFECEHKVDILFLQLPQKYGDELRTKIYEQIHQNEESLMKNLNQISNLFVEARYFFERDTIGYSNFFTDLVHLVCDYVIDMKKEYIHEEDDILADD